MFWHIFWFIAYYTKYWMHTYFLNVNISTRITKCPQIFIFYHFASSLPFIFSNFQKKKKWMNTLYLQKHAQIFLNEWMKKNVLQTLHSKSWHFFAFYFLVTKIPFPKGTLHPIISSMNELVLLLLCCYLSTGLFLVVVPFSFGVLTSNVFHTPQKPQPPPPNLPETTEQKHSWSSAVKIGRHFREILLLYFFINKNTNHNNSLVYTKKRWQLTWR